MPLIFLVKKINNKPQNNSNIYLTSNVAKSEQNLTKFQKIYMYVLYTYIRLQKMLELYTHNIVL